ncbi:hypothetical protein PTI98_005869 [Pleurotus ostreatus]|nr:hypothetical protein PTI98_005869 [Pleurotus ostreatus]
MYLLDLSIPDVLTFSDVPSLGITYIEETRTPKTARAHKLLESATRSTAVVPAVPAAVRPIVSADTISVVPTDPNVAAIVAHVLVVPVIAVHAVIRATRTVVSVDAPAAAANSRVPRNNPGTVANPGPAEKRRTFCEVPEVPPGK